MRFLKYAVMCSRSVLDSSLPWTSTHQKEAHLVFCSRFMCNIAPTTSWEEFKIVIEEKYRRFCSFWILMLRAQSSRLSGIIFTCSSLLVRTDVHVYTVWILRGTWMISRASYASRMPYHSMKSILNDRNVCAMLLRAQVSLRKTIFWTLRLCSNWSLL